MAGKRARLVWRMLLEPWVVNCGEKEGRKKSEAGDGYLAAPSEPSPRRQSLKPATRSVSVASAITCIPTEGLLLLCKAIRWVSLACFSLRNGVQLLRDSLIFPDQYAPLHAAPRSDEWQDAVWLQRSLARRNGSHALH